MTGDKINVRFGSALIEQIEAYSKQHGLGRAEVIRLAVINQLKRNPPKNLPDGVERAVGNPNASEAGKAGAAARWNKDGEDSQAS